MVNGDDVSVIGKGDLHDILYDTMIYTVDRRVEGTEDGNLGVVDNLIRYQLEIYPSTLCDEMKESDTCDFT